jgi:hypothetical protein
LTVPGTHDNRHLPLAFWTNEVTTTFRIPESFLEETFVAIMARSCARIQRNAGRPAKCIQIVNGRTHQSNEICAKDELSTLVRRSVGGEIIENTEYSAFEGPRLPFATTSTGSCAWKSIKISAAAGMGAIF